MKRAIVILILLLILGVLFVGGQTTKSNSTESQDVAEKEPDLVPVLHSPMNGEIRVKNIGNGPADPTKLTLDCVKVDAPFQMHSCPNLPISVAPTYFDPAFPNNATIKVPALAPGAVFTHKISFWDVSNWPKGKYKFTVTVDAAHELNESNSTNNVATGVLIIH
jgi:hypothetical protein